jgi:hypothetical protein
METTNTSASTKRFTINNFKQEIKELAEIQHTEKLFFKHPERYPDFLEENRSVLEKEYSKGRTWHLKRFDEVRITNLRNQASISQSACLERRYTLSWMYHDYYALKHWKKLNIEDNESMLEYFYSDVLRGYTEEEKPAAIAKMMKDLSEKTYISNDPETQRKAKEIDDKYYNKHSINTKEKIDMIAALPHISWFDWKRAELLKKIDKED